MVGRLRWQRIPVGSIGVRYSGHELAFLIGYSLFYIGLSGITAQLILHRPLPLFGSPDFLLDYWYFLFFKITFLLVMSAATFWAIGYQPRDLVYGGLSARDFVGAAVGLAAGFCINLSYVGDIQRQLNNGAISHGWLRIAVAVLIALFNAGIPEEFVFRYWLQTRMERKFGRLAAILGTALLFTAWHIPSRYFLAFGSEGRAGSMTSVVFHTGRIAGVPSGAGAGDLVGPLPQAVAADRAALGHRHTAAGRGGVGGSALEAKLKGSERACERDAIPLA